MKKYLLNLIPLLMAALMASCGKQEEGTTSNYTIEEVSADDHVTVYKTNLGHVIRDTMGVAPQNEKVDITDSMGRPLAVAGRASECSEYTLVKYLYDKQGNIAGFVRFPINEADQYSCDAIEAGETFERQFDDNSTETYSEERILFDQVLTKDDSEPYFERYYFKRDSVGRIIKVYDPILHKSITADHRWHIEYKIEMDANFWASDINGGKLWVTFTLQPNNDEDITDDGHMRKRKFYGYVDARDMGDDAA